MRSTQKQRKKTGIKKNTIRKYKKRGGGDSSSSADSIAKVQSHKKRVIKKKSEKTKRKKPILKIVETFIEEQIPILKTHLKTPPEKIHSMEPPKGRLNEKFIDLMETLSSIMLKQGEPFRARAYQKAQETIMSYQGDITSASQLKGLPGIGDTIMKKLEEYVETGTLKVIEREKNNPINILGEIYGVGPKKAKELVEKGVTTIDQLKERQVELLNDIQRVGLKYNEDIQQRIPRSEIDEYASLFHSIFEAVKTPDSRFEIVGSYRRGAKSSGDIDVIITSSKNIVFKEFVDLLIKKGVIVSDGVLSRGNTKCLVIAKLNSSSLARRLDFLYTSQEEYPFSVLYFTGSKIFNTVMRGRALALGFSLNEHGIYKMEGKTKGDKVSETFTDEEDIFKFLKMVYKNPEERIDGRAVVVSLGENKKVSTIPEIAPINPPVAEPVKTKKAKTLKKKLKIVDDVVSNNAETELKKVEPVTEVKEETSNHAIELAKSFKKNGISVLEKLSENDLISIIVESDKAFHYNKVPFLTDNEYDIVKEYAENKFPSNPIFLEVGTAVEKNKVTLPYEMASMDKIKPDTGALTSWKQKYGGPYVLSCKLDGVSGMYSTEGKTPKLYTRGNGKVGQDVSHLIPFLRLPNIKGIVVRGEFIIPKKVFEEKYSSKFANPRNLVAGIVNRQTLDEKAKDLHFVAYEVIKPELPPSSQMKNLKDNGFEVVMNRSETTITNELLSQILVEWRTNYIYEIDGVIVSDDKIYDRKSGNPDHAFAFKMVLSDQMAEAKVVDVIWAASKDGYLKPRVQIEPINLGGVKIEYATGFNGAFIEQNKIGVGALIQIIRSGDVIPYIKSITTPAETAKMPNVPYKWNDTHVDIILENIESDVSVKEKNITGFFRGIEVDGLSSGNISRIIAAGYDSVPKIIHMNKEDFLKVEGFKEKLATKIYEGIHQKLDKATLTQLMSASNIFGRGFSDKKIDLILESYPNILTMSGSEAEKIKIVAGIKGMALKTSEAFVQKIPAFLSFLKECGLDTKIQSNVETLKPAVDESHPLYKKSIVMTGVRDKKIMESLKLVGASLGSSVSKNTFVVIAKSKEEDTGKAEEAKKLGIPIMTPDEFLTTYFPAN